MGGRAASIGVGAWPHPREPAKHARVRRPLGRGPLAVIHKGTIAIAVAGFLTYGLWAGRNFRAAGDAGSAVGCIAGIGGAVVTALYLRALLLERSPDA
jgi:hypothetical protein